VPHPGPDVEGGAGIGDPHLGPLGRRGAFFRFALGEIGGDVGPVPERFVEPAVEPGGFIDGERPQGVIGGIVYDCPLLGTPGCRREQEGGEQQENGGPFGWSDAVLQRRVLLVNPVGITG
jgi:hypothetical protein